MEKILGFRNLQEKLEKILGGNIAAFYVIFQENKDFATIKSSSFSIALCIDLVIAYCLIGLTGICKF